MTCPGHREAGARGEDQAGKPWRRKHTGTGKQPGTADELYGHDAGVCHAVALRMDGRAQLVAEGDRRTIAAAQVAADMGGWRLRGDQQSRCSDRVVLLE